MVAASRPLISKRLELRRASGHDDIDIETHQLRRSCRSLGDGKGSLRGGALGRGQDRGQADLSAERRRTGASRPGVAQDRRLDGPHGVSDFRRGTHRMRLFVYRAAEDLA